MVRSANRCLGKVSQVFMFDLILAFTIFLVSIGVFFSYFLNTTENLNIYELNLELMQSFTSTKINALNSEEVRDLFVQNRITNVENTVAQQAAEYYFDGDDATAQYLTEIFIEDYVPRNVNINISLINDTEVTQLYLLAPKSVSFENSSSTSILTRSVFGFKNRTHYYGPYEVKIEIWQ